MRPDGPIEGLTPAQKAQARIAGIPADRPGLGDEYPKMIYKPGNNPRHQIAGKEPIELKVANIAYCETAFVDSAEDEAEAIENGWFLSPDPALQALEVEKRKAETAKDDEIAALKAQLAAKGTLKPKEPTVTQ